MTEELGSEEGQFDFDAKFQRKIGHMILMDGVFAAQVGTAIKPEYFTESAVAAAVNVVMEFQQVHKSVPDRTSIAQVFRDAIGKKLIRDDQRKEVIEFVRDAFTADLTGGTYVASKVDAFIRHQAIEQAMMKSIPLLDKQDFDGIAKIMEQATRVGISTDTGHYDYWAEIENRTATREDFAMGRVARDGISTGYSAMDAYLYHQGWGRKELSCIMGAAKSGKSLSLGDFTKNASMLGYAAAYFSLEVSGKIISDRLDAAISDFMMKELVTDREEIERRIKIAQAKSGALIMKDFASGQMKPMDLFRSIENFRKDGIVLDLCTVDYADLMAANYRSDNQIENLRTIYVDLRAIAFDFNLAMLTATQTNRDGAKTALAKATDVGDDWNKARTVDILIGINATDDEKKDDEARLYWALSRNTEDGFVLKIKQNRSKMQFITKILGKEAA